MTTAVPNKYYSGHSHRNRGRLKYSSKRSGERNVENRFQIQLYEVGDGSTRCRWIETSGMWLTIFSGKFQIKVTLTRMRLVFGISWESTCLQYRVVSSNSNSLLPGWGLSLASAVNRQIMLSSAVDHILNYSRSQWTQLQLLDVQTSLYTTVQVRHDSVKEVSQSGCFGVCEW